MSYKPRISFESSPTVWAFFLDRAFVTGIEGPLGSGKSVGCCAKIMANAMDEEPAPDGWRRSRWVVIRNTYPELETTTINTWLEIFPEDKCGPLIRGHPIRHRIRVPPKRGQPGLDLEVLFLALDRPADVKHLKSLETTGAWINEASEVPVEILDMLTGRVGRYPPTKDMETGLPIGDGRGAKNVQIILDTNSPDDQSWWFKSAVLGDLPNLQYETPDGEVIDISWSFHKQPPALLECAPLQTGGYIVCEPGFAADDVKPTRVLPSAGRFWTVNPAAENLPNVRPGYYAQQIANKTLEWIQRYMQAKYVFLAPGKPWVPEYNDGLMSKHLKYSEGFPLFGGMDVGGGTLQPAATIGQLVSGQHRTLAELSMFDIGIERFVEELHRFTALRFPGVDFSEVPFYIDPAAVARDEVYEVVVQEHLKARGVNAIIAPSNDPDVRREALVGAMNRLIPLPNGQAEPGYVVDKGCPLLRAGLSGKWFRKRIQVAGDARYKERPEKTDESHVCDADSYRLSGGGETMNLRRGHLAGTPRQRTVANPWPQAQGSRTAPNQPPRMGFDFDPFDA